jgi:alpha-amylase
MNLAIHLATSLLFLLADQPRAAADPAVFWNNATIYFLLTDRFHNGDPGNDRALGRAPDGAVLRSFQGGDLRGVLQKIEAGYFDSLGVDAIWLTPFVEQVHGSVDEGTGKTYGYHGYWTRDWTAVDPALGTKEDLRALVAAAHRHGIRVLMDAVINHTGPATAQDPRWPDDWVRRGPNCTYRDYATTVTCNLVATLPDILTERDAPVELPAALIEMWRREGRLEQERAGLDAFFARTGYPRAPRYYVIKWLTDWVREFGLDGYRVDTAKHFEEAVSAALKREAQRAFDDWKRAHPAEALDSLPFYMVGEVYGWDVGQGRSYDFGDRRVSFFDFGYDALINFAFKREAAGSMDSLFTRYAAALRDGALEGAAILNYVTSHDDGAPYDLDRADPLGAGTRLLLAPGGAQIYYGDELARPLRVPGTAGDANLRSSMNWADLERGGRTAEILRHWRALGRFRRAHPAVGSGAHRRLQVEPYVFSRTLDHDRVIVAMDQGTGMKTIPVLGVFPDGTELEDAYSGARGTVRNGRIALTTPAGLVLLDPAKPSPALAPDTSWVTRSTIYEVFVRDFSPEGDLQGVIRGLDRIQAVGADVVWLMPIYPIGVVNRKEPLGSPYSVRDYRAIDSAYGTAADFRALVAAVHARGMKLILDWVPNHTAWDHVWVREHPDFYVRDDSGGLTVPRDEQGKPTNWTDVAQLDYRHPPLRREMIATMRYWLEEFGIDGFRVDVAGFVPDDFWREAVPALRGTVQRPILLLAEWGDLRMHRLGFDLTYGWDGYSRLKSVWGASGDSAVRFVRGELNERQVMPAGGMRLRFTTNHDETAWDNPPVIRFDGAAGARAAFVAMALLPGRPLIYNGQEVESPQKLGLFVRDAVRWDQPAAARVRDFYRRVLELARAQRSGELAAVETNAPAEVIAYRRGAVVVLVNARPRGVRVALTGGGFPGGRTRDLLSGRRVRGDTIALPAYGAMVLQAR